MINYIYQLVSPGNFSVKYEEINFKNEVIVRPLYMAICHADQRYYLGKRDIKKLKSKLPMALIHESMGEVVYDPTGTYVLRQPVVMIPNVPGDMCNNIVYENYQKESKFMSSGIDGFMREFINIPKDRIIPFKNIDFKVASICEFVSVGVHAIKRFISLAHSVKDKIGIWGDGSLAYVIACILKESFPNSKIAVIGRNIFKLSQFTFVDEVYLADEIPDNFSVDHAFECAGGSGSFYAIDDIINYINPQGTVVLLGVSENKVAINTRDVLEKGLTFLGCSRSGKEDFEKSIKFLEMPKFQNRLNRIIYEDDSVKSILDIHRVFKTDLNTSFKTVFKWDL